MIPDPAPPSNTEKEPEDWVYGCDPITGAQASYLKTLSEECGAPDALQEHLTKAEASKRGQAKHRWQSHELRLRQGKRRRHVRFARPAVVCASSFRHGRGTCRN